MGKAGRWVDKEVLQNKWIGWTNPATLGYQYFSKTGAFQPHSQAWLDAQKGPGPLPPPVDITDKAVQDARRREEFRTGSGSRRNSFITGPMGDKTNIPVMGKSVITGG